MNESSDRMMNTDDIKRTLWRAWRRDIGLSVDWTSPSAVSVSWYDSVLVDDGTRLKGRAYNIAIGLLVGGIGLPFVFQSFWPLLLILVLLVYVPLASTVQEINKKTIAFDPTAARFNGRQISLDRISRVSISAYEEWYDLTREEQQDRNKIPFKRTVDLWVDDVERIELSRNNFSKETNLYIKSAIENALAAIKKASAEKVQAKAHGKAGEFGMPDY